MSQGRKKCKTSILEVVMILVTKKLQKNQAPALIPKKSYNQKALSSDSTKKRLEPKSFGSDSKKKIWSQKALTQASKFFGGKKAWLQLQKKN